MECLGWGFRILSRNGAVYDGYIGQLCGLSLSAKQLLADLYSRRLPHHRSDVLQRSNVHAPRTPHFPSWSESFLAVSSLARLTLSASRLADPCRGRVKITFLVADFISLVLQAAGGGIAATAETDAMSDVGSKCVLVVRRYVPR